MLDYKKLIEQRQSSREFERKPIPETDIKELQDFFGKAARLEGSDLELKIYSDDRTYMILEGVAGYNGYAFEAPLYLAFLGKKSDEAYVGAGFTAMNMVLKLEDMGYDSCFLTLEDGDLVKRVLKLDSDLDVLTIIAAGKSKKEIKLRRIDIHSPSDVTMSKREGYLAPKISRSELVYDGVWGKKLEYTENRPNPILAEAFYSASLAPSFFNRQLYRYIYKEGKVAIATKIDDKTNYEDIMIGLGCTMFNFYIVYSEDSGISETWHFDKGDVEVPQGYEVLASMRV